MPRRLSFLKAQQFCKVVETKKLMEKLLQDENLVGKTFEADGEKKATVVLNTTLSTLVDKAQERLSELPSGVFILKVGG